LQLNERARVLADWCAAHATQLRIGVQRRPGGACVIDAGINVPGGFGAGQKIAEICMGGLADIAFVPLTIAGTTWPGVQVWTDHPTVACMASQYAGWQIAPDGYFAMGSGPLRAHARVEKELFDKLAYEEEASHGVLVLETRTLPSDDVIAWIAATSSPYETDASNRDLMRPSAPTRKTHGSLGSRHSDTQRFLPAEGSLSL